MRQPLFPEVREGVVVITAFDRGGRAATSHRIEVPDLPATIAALRLIAEARCKWCVVGSDFRCPAAINAADR
jgi:hypothetical protein